MSASLFMQADALLSPCRRYRYWLSRTWDPAKPVMVWILLNPSTADARRDDPTLRKCIGFATRHRCGAVLLLNLFAWRAKDPKTLPTVADPVGPQNDAYIAECLRQLTQPIVVAAWGADRFARFRALELRLKLGDRRLMCLGQAAAGQPKHPLYLPYSTPFQELV